MSNLGNKMNYIHFFYNNYKTRGLNRYGRSGIFTENPKAIFNKQRKHLKLLAAQINKKNNYQDMKNLEDALNSFFRGNINNDEARAQYVWDVLVNKLSETYLPELVQGIERETGALLSSDKSGKKVSLNKIKIEKEGSLKDGKNPNTEFNTLQKRIHFLKRALEQGFLKGEEAKKISKELSSIRERLGKIRASLPNEIKASYYEREDYKNLIDDLNNIIGDYNKSYVLNHLRGDLFEWIIAFVSHEMATKGLENYNEEVLKKIMPVGGSSTPIQYTYSDLGISDSTYFLNQIRNYHDANGVQAVANLTSQDKTDIILQLNEQEYQVSAKNYASGIAAGKISLVSGAPLLAMAQNLQFREGFLHHYLNVVSLHGVGIGKDGGYRQAPSDLIKQAHDTMAETLFVGALRGYKGSGYNQSDLLIVNNSGMKKGGDRVSVLDMGSIISLFLNTSNFNSISDIQINESGSLYHFAPENKWETQGPERRVDNVLLKAHQAKVSIKVKTELLRQVKKL